jgi:hypothetical protein
VTEEDINALPEEEFDEVWAALGKVAKARSRATREREQAKAKAAIRPYSGPLEGLFYRPPVITPAGHEADEEGQ